MTKREAQLKARRTSVRMGRPFKPVRVLYSNGKPGWDVEPSGRKNPARRGSTMTKKQRSARASRAAKQRGIVKAVKGLLKKTNPSAKITGARVVKLRDGVLKITPIKANRGRR